MWVLKNRLQHQATKNTHLYAKRPFPIRFLPEEILKKKNMCNDADRKSVV